MVVGVDDLQRLILTSITAIAVRLSELSFSFASPAVDFFSLQVAQLLNPSG